MRKPLLIVGATASVAALGIAIVLLRGTNPEGTPYQPSQVSNEQLQAVAEARVLFAHQSVGKNIIDGIPAVYEAHDLPVPEFTRLPQAEPQDNLLHLRIGVNGDPLGKIEAFDELIRSGLGNTIDAAILKLCYVDVHAGTDIHGVFTAYRDTLAALQRDYPDVAFIAATVPLTTTDGPLDTVKSWLGRGDGFGPEDNLARQQMSELLRAEYAESGPLLDIAALESTTPGGARITGRHEESLYYALEDSYASDTAHLNSTGAAIVAEGLLAVVGNAVQD